MSGFDDLYKRYGGVDAPTQEQPPQAPITATTTPTDYWSELHRRYGVILQEPTLEQSKVGYAAIPTPLGGVISVDLSKPTTTTPTEEVKRGGEIAKGKEAVKAPMEISTEGLTPGAAGFRLGTMDTRQGAEKLAGVVGYEPDYAAKVRDLAERKMLESEIKESPVIGTIGRIGGQIISGAGPAGYAVNRIAGATPVIGNFLLGRAGQNALTRSASMGSQGALQGATGAAITSGQSDRPLGKQIKEGAEFGGLLGGGLGFGGTGAARAMSGGMDPEVARLADLGINKYGLNSLRASQISENPLVRKADQITGQFALSGAASRDGALRSEYTRALTNTFGEDTDRLTSAVAHRAQRRLGNTLEQIETAYPVNLNNSINDFANIETRIRQLPNEGDQKTLITAIHDVFRQLNPGGTIDGKTFGQLIHNGSHLDNLLNSSSSDIRNIASDIKSTLRDALQTSLPADQAALYGQTRGQYHNLMALLPLVNKSPTGYISPTAVNQAVTNSWGRRERALYGAGDLGELGFIGQQFLKEPKDSGTPFGQMVQSMVDYPGRWLAGAALTGGAGGAGLGYMDPHTLAALPISVGVARALRMPMNSPMLRDAAINQALGRPLNPLMVAPVTSSANLLGTQTNQLLPSPQNKAP